MPLPPIIGVPILLIVLFLVIRAIWKASKKNGTKPIKAIGLEGHGLVKSLIELNLVKDGDILKDAMAGKQYTVTEAQVIYENLKGKKTLAYIVDMQSGSTVALQKGGSITTAKTNPTLINNVVDSRIIQDAFNLRPSRGVIVVAVLIGIAAGIFIGLMF
jgi:hypothetical protein